MAQGYYYHKYNALKYRILEAADEMEGPVTAQDIADYTGLDRNRISIFFTKCIKYHYRYFRRLTKKAPGGNHKSYRYSITKYGRATLEMYKKRMSKGYTLNCKRRFDLRKVTDGYIGIGERGIEEGISAKDAYMMAGLEVPERLKAENQVM